ncbi:MAG: alpha-glucosidase/alpha-galactosidase [Planctomycetaceae bacterium]|nr:MAG: alpha-glucosidase/alpha-galactosidase [Planctomycetaceae bacterium]
MKKINKDARKIKIAYIGGGSRGWAHNLMADLALCDKLTGEVALYDINLPMAQLNARWGKRVNDCPQSCSQWKYTVAKTLRQALKGADFVVASIQPGPIEMMGSDLEIPKKYGILHTVGDTVGPAGLCRALRSAIDYAEIASAVQAVCPDAWVINFTNPMTVCTRTLYKVFPNIKAFGCCHEVFSTQKRLVELVKEYTGQEITRQQVRVNVMGVNHFTWIDKAQYKDIDLIELYRRKMNTKGEVREITDAECEKVGFFEHHRQVGYDLFKRYGILPAAGERHLVEFVPFYLKDEKTLHRWGVNLTPYSFRIGRYTSLPQEFKKKLADSKPFEVKKTGEEAVEQMLALLGMNDFRTNVNLPNIGQTEGLPRNAVIETNAYFSENSVKPEFAGRLPQAVEALTNRVIASQEMIVEAALTRNKELAFQAFLNDALMSLTTDQAWKMFNEMLKATKAKLPGWKI